MTQFKRQVAPRVTEVHSRLCARSAKRPARCSCDPTFVARVAGNGSRVIRTFSTLSEATAWVEAARDAARVGQLRPHAEGELKPTFGQVATSFVHRAKRGDVLTRSRTRYADSTVRGYDTALRHHALDFVDGRSGLPLRDARVDVIDGRAVQNLVDALASRESPAVARVTSAAVSSVLEDAFARGFVDSLPPRVKLPPPPATRAKGMTMPEADALLEAARADDERTGKSLMAPLVALLLCTGCREAELLAATWGTGGLDLDGDSAALRVNRASTKTDSGARVVPLDGATVAALRAHRNAMGNPKDGAPVFTYENGEPLKRAGRVRAGFKRIAEALKLERLSAHDFRHARGTWLARSNVHPSVAARVLGHSDGGTLFMRTYQHVDDTDAAAAQKAVEALQDAARADKTAVRWLSEQPRKRQNAYH